MRIAELRTKHGKYIHRVVVPLFVPGNEAEIVQWGSRHFVLATHDDGDRSVAQTTEDNALVYTEGLCYVAQDD